MESEEKVIVPSKKGLKRQPKCSRVAATILGASLIFGTVGVFPSFAAEGATEAPDNVKKAVEQMKSVMEAINGIAEAGLAVALTPLGIKVGLKVTKQVLNAA